MQPHSGHVTGSARRKETTKRDRIGVSRIAHVHNAVSALKHFLSSTNAPLVTWPKCYDDVSVQANAGF